MAETDTMERAEVHAIDSATYEETSAETKTADESCQRTIAATAIICAGCPLVAFCPKASTEPTPSEVITEQNTLSAAQPDMQEDGLSTFNTVGYMANVPSDIIVEPTAGDLVRPVENDNMLETHSKPRPSYLDQLMDDSVPVVVVAPPQPAPSRTPELVSKPNVALPEGPTVIAQASWDTIRIESTPEQTPATGTAAMAIPTQERDTPRTAHQPFVMSVPTERSQAKPALPQSLQPEPSVEGAPLSDMPIEPIVRNVSEQPGRLINEPERLTEDSMIPKPLELRIYDDMTSQLVAPQQSQFEKSRDTPRNPQQLARREAPSQNNTAQSDDVTNSDWEELSIVERDDVVMVSPYAPLAETEDELYDEHDAAPLEPTPGPPFITHSDDVLSGDSEDTIDDSHIVELRGHKYGESADNIGCKRDDQYHQYTQAIERAGDAPHDDEPEPAVGLEADTIDAPNLESQDDDIGEQKAKHHKADIASRVLDETNEQVLDEGIEYILPQPIIKATTGTLSIVLVRLLAAKALVTTLRLA